MAEGTKVFLREATGLTKELSLFDSVVFNLSVSIPGFALLLFAAFGPVSFPGINLIFTIFLAGIFMLVHATVTGQMMASMPRSGYDYVFVSRVIHPAVGFANSFAFFFFQGTIGGVFFTFMNQYLASYFSGLGLITGNAGYTDLSNLISQPLYVATLGTIFNIIITSIVLGGLRIGKKALLVTQAIGWLGLITALAIIGTSSPPSFAAAWDKYLGSQVAYANVISSAQKGGLVYLGGLGALLGATFFTLFSTFGYQTIGYVGGEVKRAQSNIIKSMILALLVTLVAVGIGLALIQSTVGYNFLVSAEYLNIAGNVTQSMYYTTIATLLFPNVAASTFIYVGIIMWLFITILALMLALTRTIFAWSFDGAVPRLFSNVSERFHSPTWSVILIGVLFEVGVIASSQIGALGLLVDLGLFLFLSYSVNTLASALLPWVRPSIFKSSTRIVNYRLGPVPLITITGGITTLFFWAVSYGIIVNPAIAGAVTPTTALSIVTVVAIGAVTYYIAKAYRRSKGFDLGLVFKEIPPE